MILFLLAAAALLYFPGLRRGCGAFVIGYAWLALMALAFGSAGALVALLVGAVLFIGVFWRPDD